MLFVVRIVVPAVIGLAGIVVLIVGSGSAAAGLGVVLIGIAGLVVLTDLFARLSLSSQDDRAREERARRRFSRTGRWTG